MANVQISGWLRGKKTYIMILVGALDQVGVLYGYWEASHLREIAEATFGLAFLRAGVAASAPDNSIVEK